MKKYIVSLLRKLLGIAKSVFFIFTDSLKDEALRLLNDALLQELATKCVVAAAAKGLYGDSAWREAWEKFSYELKKRGRTIPLNIAETILQTAYTVWRNT